MMETVIGNNYELLLNNKDFEIEVKVSDKEDEIEYTCRHLGVYQGSLVASNYNKNISLNIKQYIGVSVLTLRSAAPESILSEYSIAYLLCNAYNRDRSVKDKITPERFGCKSYLAMRKEEEFDELSRDEIIQRCIKAEDLVSRYL